MPRSAASHVSGSAYSSRGGRGSSLSVEQIAGVAILAVVVAILFIVGCWIFKRRSGYNILRSRHFGPSTVQSMFGGYREDEVPMNSKVPLQEYSNLNIGSLMPGAPPAYDKLAAEPALPPPYTP